MMKAAAPITGGINCPPVEPTDFDRGGARRREARARHQRNGDDADRHHIAHRGARDHAEQRRADHRDLGGAAAEAAHRRHGEIGEISGAAGAAEHLAHQRERHHDQHRDRQDRADHAVGVEAEIDQQALRRHRAGGEIARHMRADEDIGRDARMMATSTPPAVRRVASSTSTIRMALPMMPSSGSSAIE